MLALLEIQKLAKVYVLKELFPGVEYTFLDTVCCFFSFLKKPYNFWFNNVRHPTGV